MTAETENAVITHALMLLVRLHRLGGKSQCARTCWLLIILSLPPPRPRPLLAQRLLHMTKHDLHLLP